MSKRATQTGTAGRKRSWPAHTGIGGATRLAQARRRRVANPVADERRIRSFNADCAHALQGAGKGMAPSAGKDRL
jgi:hypothetical protein